jgi:hypothetical protein
MGVFYGLDHKYVVNWHFHKQLLANGMWQGFWGGPIFRFRIYIFVLLMKLNTRAICNDKTSSIILCT